VSHRSLEGRGGEGCFWGRFGSFEARWDGLEGAFWVVFLRLLLVCCLVCFYLLIVFEPLCQSRLENQVTPNPPFVTSTMFLLIDKSLSFDPFQIFFYFLLR